MTISNLYEGSKEQGDIQKVVSKGWCKESKCLYRNAQANILGPDQGTILYGSVLFLLLLDLLKSLLGGPPLPSG